MNTDPIRTEELPRAGGPGPQSVRGALAGEAAIVDRALGALVGVALGDALGMPTQSFTRAQIVARFGTVIRGLMRGGADQPLAPNLPAGTTTDDTDQTMIVAELVISGEGMVDEWTLASRLSSWEDQMIQKGSADLLGPSTRRALDALAAGFGPDSSGRTGTTNGAAMRIAPVGIAFRPGPGLEAATVQASRLTHNTSSAMAGAFAVATAVSHALEGATLPAAVQAAADAAAVGAGRGQPSTSPPLAPKLQALIHDVWGMTPSAVFAYVTEVTGTSLATEESVAAAFAFALAVGNDPWLAIRMAASAGGDCDTIAAMTGAILGACHGVAAFPPEARAAVEQRNALTLQPLAEALVHIRLTRDSQPEVTP